MWRGHEVPPPSAFGLPPRTPLNKMLEHFSDAVRVVRFADGRPARLQAVVPREVTLGLCAPTTDKLPDSAADAAANAAAAAANANAAADAAADPLPTVKPPAAAARARGVGPAASLLVSSLPPSFLAPAAPAAPPAATRVATPRLRLRVAPASATTVSISLTAAIIDLAPAPPSTAATAATPATATAPATAAAAPTIMRAVQKCLPGWFERCLPSGCPVKDPHGSADVYASAPAASASTAAAADAAALAAAATTAAAAAVPPVIIVGGGIGGLAAAVALQVRGIPCVVYERDLGLEGIRRGYGLTLGPTCWAALADLGLEHKVRAIDDSVGSNAHWVFDEQGGVLGYFGTAFSQQQGKGRNLRVPRQLLRRMLYEQLAPGTVRWGWPNLDPN